MAINLQQLGNSLGQAIAGIGTYSAQAADQANAISRQAQSAQGAFNQASANQANMLQDQSIQAQYGYNSAMMNNANQFTADMWNQAAAYNEEQWDKAAEFNREMWEDQKAYNSMMWEKQADFNSVEASIARKWQKNMDDTKYQRSVKDMAAAGLNPILAATNGISAGVPGGSTATVGGSSVGGLSMSPSTMTSAQGQMAQGGLLGAHSASESNYMGQMEYLSGTLGLISAVIGGLSSASDAAGQLGDLGQGIMDEVSEAMEPENLKEAGKEALKTAALGPVGGALKTIYEGGKKLYNKWNSEQEKQFTSYKNKLRRNSTYRLETLKGQHKPKG